MISLPLSISKQWLAGYGNDMNIAWSIRVNGKDGIVRGIPLDATDSDIQEIALTTSRVVRTINGRIIVKIEMDKSTEVLNIITNPQ